mgnify:CR=1 FL=1
MPYAEPFIKVDIKGDCYGESEIWNTSLKLQLTAPLGSIDQETLEVATQRVNEAWQTFFTGSHTGNFSSAYRTTEIKAAHIGVDGKYAEDAYYLILDTPYSGAAGTTTGNPLAQSAVAGTFYSQRQRGPASKGRMYLPGVKHSVGTDGLMNQAMTTAIATAFNTFINDINDQGSIIDHPMRVVLTSPVSTGFMLPVIQTGVDRKVDTQRRRANALSSDYVVLPVE